jgi:quercetin dioxygenase-like cupin family protein
MVLQGSITMLLDDDDVELSAGDVVIQNGTNHAWANRGHAPCLMAFVLIDAPGDRRR